MAELLSFLAAPFELLQREDIDWWTLAQFGSIPVVASLIGYGTNVLAIQMTFLPLEYIGWFEDVFRATGFSLGWQGIIPANAVKISEKAVTIITTRLVTVPEVFARLEKHRIIDLMREPMLKSMERILDRVVGENAPDVWEAMSLSARHELAIKACEDAEPYVGAIFDDLRANIQKYLDLHSLAVEKLTEDKALMNEVFKRCGAAEFRFIELSGFYFGFLLGCLQGVIWWGLLHFRATLDEPQLLPLWWFLPMAGALCGYVTNALALGIIFNPIDPIYVFGVKLQGLFLQRQAEVSEEFATISAARVITAKHCWEHLLFGAWHERFESMVLKHTIRAIDEQVGLMRPFVPLLVGGAKYRAMREQAAVLLLRELPSCLQATYMYTEEAMDMQRLLAGRMQKLPPAEFERVLHPAFEEDEWKLIGVGGLLGAVAGTFQLLFVFSEAVR